jgi:hypothetical protein
MCKRLIPCQVHFENASEFVADVTSAGQEFLVYSTKFSVALLTDFLVVDLNDLKQVFLLLGLLV